MRLSSEIYFGVGSFGVFRSSMHDGGLDRVTLEILRVEILDFLFFWHTRISCSSSIPQDSLIFSIDFVNFQSF